MFRDRAHERHRVSIEGKVLAPDLSSIVDCVIRDVSAGGALISVAGDAEVPDRFYLWQAQTRTKLECEVRWRKFGLVGLSFVAPEILKLRALMRACRPPVALRMPVSPRPGLSGVQSRSWSAVGDLVPCERRDDNVIYMTTRAPIRPPLHHK